MEEDIAYQLAADAVGAAIVAAIRLNPGCEPSEFVAHVLDKVSWSVDVEVDDASLPPLTAPAIRSLNHRLNIAVGYLGVDKDEQHFAVDNARKIIKISVLVNSKKGGNSQAT